MPLQPPLRCSVPPGVTALEPRRTTARERLDQHGGEQSAKSMPAAADQPACPAARHGSTPWMGGAPKAAAAAAWATDVTRRNKKCVGAVAVVVAGPRRGTKNGAVAEAAEGWLAGQIVRGRGAKNRATAAVGAAAAPRPGGQVQAGGGGTPKTARWRQRGRRQRPPPAAAAAGRGAGRQKPRGGGSGGGGGPPAGRPGAGGRLRGAQNRAAAARAHA